MPRKASPQPSSHTQLSVFRFVEHLPPELIRNRPLKVLETLRDQMENVLLRHALPGVVLAGYVRSSAIIDDLSRLRGMARLGCDLRLFGEREDQWKAPEELTFVDVPSASPLGREWFFVVDSPKFYGALIARQTSPDVRPDGDTLYASTFGFGEGLVSAVHRYLSTSCGLEFHDYGAHQYDATSLLVEEFLERIEETSQRMSALAHQLEQEARTDPLTGLANRRYWTEWVTKEFERARRYSHPLSCSLLDLDHFKTVNDAHGHDVGDAVLIELARVMRRNVRPSDLICRYGGEEFTILLPETDLEGAVEQAHRLRRALETAEIRLHGLTIKVTASLGVATFPSPSALTADDLVRAADKAMYAAKAQGRNTVATADGSSDDSS